MVVGDKGRVRVRVRSLSVQAYREREEGGARFSTFFEGDRARLGGCGIVY